MKSLIQRMIIKILGLNEEMYKMLVHEQEARAILKAIDGPSIPFDKERHGVSAQAKTSVRRYCVFAPTSLFVCDGQSWIEFTGPDGLVVQINMEHASIDMMIAMLQDYRAQLPNLVGKRELELETEGNYVLH